MVSTSRKEALNPFPLAGKRLLLKIGFLPISISRKMRLFFGNLILSNFNNGFHQQNCKILSCLGEIVFFYSEFLLVEPIIKTWMPIFKEKLLCSQQKLFFWLVKNSFFHLSDISGCEQFFHKVETYFLAKSLFRLVEKDFLSSGNVFLNESSNPYGGDVFSILWKPLSLI